MNRRQAMFGMGALGASTALAGASRAQTAPDLWGRVSTMIEAIIAERLTPGLQITVRKGDALLFDRGFGSANLETATPMTPAGVLRVGSLTKQFTAATLLLLEADGVLSLDDPLSRFLPDVPRAADLSLLRMANHTSGLGNYTDAASVQAFLQGGRPDRSTDEMVALMAASADLQKTEPGTAWAYSNTAYVLLGAVIEKATGRPYGAVMQGRLFGPLGLAATAVDDPAQILPGRVAGYTNVAMPTAFENASFLSMTYPGAAGSMRSTTADLCRWHQALLGGKVLSPAGLAKMLTPAVLADGSRPADGTLYGLGVSLSPQGAPALVSHTGGINGFASYLGTYRDADLSIATIVNADGGFGDGASPGPRVQAVRRVIRDALLV
jgi:D-alanyl-D-alanine carboxypeptidase